MKIIENVIYREVVVVEVASSGDAAQPPCHAFGLRARRFES